MHCVIMSVLLPRKEVLRDRIQYVGAENLRNKHLCETFFERYQYLVSEDFFRHGVCPFHDWDVHVDYLELVWPIKQKKDEHMQMLAIHLFT